MSLQGQWLCGIQLSTIRLSAPTAHTGNNWRLYSMGNLTLLLSLTSSEHDAHVMYPDDDLMLLTDLLNVSKLSCLRPWALSSIINYCFNMPPQSFCFSHLQTVGWTTHTPSHQMVDTKMLTGYDKVWPYANETLLLTLNCGRRCHCKGSGSAGFSCPLSDYQSRPTARTGNNWRLYSMGTSPFSFR